MRKKVLEITPQGCADVFSQWGRKTYDDDLLDKTPEEIALVVFTGGHDVCPELYGENCRRGTFFSLERDLYEGMMFEKALKNNIPMVGICRGAQFLCVKSGGKLVQDIGGHLGSHLLETNDGRIIMCNSSHHQMQLPPDDAEILAWSKKRLSNHYLNGDNDNIDVEKEIEVVYYPSINAVGIQGHPEWYLAENAFIRYCTEIVEKYLMTGNKWEHSNLEDGPYAKQILSN